MRPTKAAKRPQKHPKVAFGKIGVLLVNLGTPSGTDYRSVRRYLSQFLSDRRVIELPAAIWQPILQLGVLTRRPFKSGEAYRSIWMEEADISPLAYYTETLARAVQASFGPEITVAHAMRYGEPSIPERLTALKQAGCDRILVVPLYPQYSATTTATVIDQVCDTLKSMRWQPAIRTVPSFHDHPVYIEEIANSILDRAATMARAPDRVLLSFHGIPRAYLEKGDPYQCFCLKTGRLVSERLAAHGLATDVSFQSRFGPQEWLRPYTADRLEALPGEGVRSLLVAAPGFVADCVETLEEINIEGRGDFLNAGGVEFAYTPCLNTSPGALRLVEAICRTELSGWIETEPAVSQPLPIAAE